MTTETDDRAKERLASVLRELVDQRGMRQKALAKRVGITESSLSHILNGRARPRQLTLTRLMQQLAVNPEEEQEIVAAYDHAEFRGLPERPSAPERPMPEDELERVRHYMAVKSQSVAFEEDVENALKEGGISFERSFRKDSIICDFYLAGPPAVGIECKFNVNRDWERAVATVNLLRKELPCEAVLIVVPHLNQLATESAQEIRGLGGKVVDLEDLLRHLPKG